MKQSRRTGVINACLGLFALTSLYLQPVHALDRVYFPTQVGCTGVFTDTNCWIGGVVPGLLDNAVFNTAAPVPYTVNFTSAVSSDMATIYTDNLNWDLGNNSYNLTNDLTVGNLSADIGNLTIANGTLSSNTAYIGRNSGSTGQTIISGANTTWNSNDLFIGDSGNGILLIDTGASVSSTNGYLGNNSGSFGTAVVFDASSNWTNSGDLIIGNLGSGDLQIYNGGSVINNTATLGNNAGINGNAFVDGPNSSWTNSGDLYIGKFGSGNLNISMGGSVSSANGHVGAFFNSIGSVSLDFNSTWNNSGDLFIGSSGNGMLNIFGGSVTNSTGYLGLNFDGVATASVGMGGTWTNNDSLYVGGSAGGAGGTGYLSVADTGSVHVTNLMKIWDLGTVDMFDGSITAGSFDSTRGTFNFSSGTLTVNGNGGTYTDGNTDLVIDGLGGISGPPTLVLSNGASADYTTGDAIISLASSGALTIEKGGSVANTDGFVGLSGSGTATVATGGIWNNSNNLYLAGDDFMPSGGTGILNVNTGGIVNIANLLKIWDSGILNLNGGTLNVGMIDRTTGIPGIPGGTIDFIAGTLNLTNSDLVVEPGGLLGNIIDLWQGKALTISGTTVINGTGLVVLDGGAFTTGSLVENGGLIFNSGTLGLTSDNVVIGAGGLFGNTAQFGSNQAVDVTTTTTVNNGAVLALNGGSFSSGVLTNNGQIQLGGAFSTVGGGILSNSGDITGGGRISALLVNQAGGEVRVGTGESLRLTAAGNINNGRIDVIGGEIEFDQGLINQASTGNIIARNATLRFTGGLDNQGTIGLSFGVSDVFGDINNTGTITQSGGGQVTFFDDLINNGVFQASTGSQAVFFGAVSGTGPFTGTGSLFFEGDLTPGNSPGLVSMGGDVSLGLNSHTIMEIAGLARGTEYDAFDIGGDLWLGGELEVSLYDLGRGLFDPQLGDSFDLFLADTISGNFDLLTLATLGGGLGWQVDVLADAIGLTDVVRLSVVTSAVPVPPAVWLFGSGLLGLFGVARRRQAA